MCPPIGRSPCPRRRRSSRSRQYITWLTLAFMTTASVASLRSAPTMAVYGLTCVFLYLVPAIIFLLPQSLVAAELASGWTGGVFRWVSEGISAEVGPAGGVVPVRDDDLLLPDAAGVRREHAGLRLQPGAGEQRRLHRHRDRRRVLVRRVPLGARRHRRDRQARLQRPADRHADPGRAARDPRHRLPAPGRDVGRADGRRPPDPAVDGDREPRADRQQLPVVLRHGDERRARRVAAQPAQASSRGRCSSRAGSC